MVRMNSRWRSPWADGWTDDGGRQRSQRWGGKDWLPVTLDSAAFHLLQDDACRSSCCFPLLCWSGAVMPMPAAAAKAVQCRCRWRQQQQWKGPITEGEKQTEGVFFSFFLFLSFFFPVFLSFILFFLPGVLFFLFIMRKACRNLHRIPPSHWIGIY